ncbi:MAG TPA: ABC transporter permease [Solirubrobacterales bacterium]|nr:ABC transporter permease [Solirubrobacterales bacterium]
MPSLGALALPLAEVGKVGEGFFHERTSATLPCQAKDELFCWDWAKENIDRYGTPTVQHLELVIASVLIGFVIAFALALLAHRHGWLHPPLIAGTGILYTIPSVALFFLLEPITGRTMLTAIIALSLYTVQIIYRNTMVGLGNVPQSVRDAARGMGQTSRQVLWRVELPLAIPEITAGLRIATVSTVALATLATFVGGGGLGEPIFKNIDFETNIIIAGGIAIAMALVFDAILFVGSQLATPWRRVESA